MATTTIPPGSYYHRAPRVIQSLSEGAIKFLSSISCQWADWYDTHTCTYTTRRNRLCCCYSVMPSTGETRLKRLVEFAENSVWFYKIAMAWRFHVRNDIEFCVWHMHLHVKDDGRKVNLFFISVLSSLFLSLNFSKATHFTPAGKSSTSSPPLRGKDEPGLHITFPEMNFCLGLQQSF